MISGYWCTRIRISTLLRRRSVTHPAYRTGIPLCATTLLSFRRELEQLLSNAIAPLLCLLIMDSSPASLIPPRSVSGEPGDMAPYSKDGMNKINRIKIDGFRRLEHLDLVFMALIGERGRKNPALQAFSLLSASASGRLK